MSLPLATLVLFVAGVAAWSFLEYVIHGWLAHTLKTFVGPLHWGHHRDPRRVFTSIVAWAPAGLVIYLVLALAVGAAPAAAFTLGVLTGFLRYEYVHWRIHFRAPRTPRQALLRAHHLAHHFRNPRAYHGVTTRLFDRLFGTLPATHADDYARVASLPPIAGRSNLGSLWPRSADPDHPAPSAEALTPRRHAASERRSG